MSTRFVGFIWTVLIVVFTSMVPALAAPSHLQPLVVDRVEVYKAKHELRLLHNDEVVRKYRVALGRRAGKKEHQGDFKTPEGRYTIDYVKRDSQFHRALHISYPNEDDYQQASLKGKRAGGDIMIHGLPDESQLVKRIHALFDWTKGCIAVTNPEIEEIAAAVKPGTPIVIYP